MLTTCFRGVIVRNTLSEYRKCIFLRKYSRLSDEGAKDTGPLDGIKILDLTRVVAGPYCTMILADLGADVIKVERPGLGDEARSWGPPFCGTESAYFLSINRNKKSIAVDLKKKEGQEIIKQLACKCDVLMENYIPGKLDSMGLGYQHLKERAPHLIYCSLTGYGQTGPYNQRAGYDIIAAGIGGLLHITGPKNGEPCKVGVAVTDLSTGLYAHGAIMAAILQRQRTGRGQHIDCDLLSTQVASLINLASNYLNAGQEAERFGTEHASIVPYQAFDTSDSSIMVGGCNDPQFYALCKAIGLEDVSKDEKFSNNKLRVKHREELIAKLSSRFKQKTTAEWLETFAGSSFPYGPINNIGQVFSDPQVLHNNMIQEFDHPTAGKVKVAGAAVRYSDYHRSQPSPSPLLGQHTESVLHRILGLNAVDIENLRKSKVIA